jgi:hypothetical protein
VNLGPKWAFIDLGQAIPEGSTKLLADAMFGPGKATTETASTLSRASLFFLNAI